MTQKVTRMAAGCNLHVTALHAARTGNYLIRYIQEHLIKVNLAVSYPVCNSTG